MTGGGGGGYKMVKDEDKLNIYCPKKCVCGGGGGGVAMVKVGH